MSTPAKAPKEWLIPRDFRKAAFFPREEPENDCNNPPHRRNRLEASLSCGRRCPCSPGVRDKEAKSLGTAEKNRSETHEDLGDSQLRPITEKRGSSVTKILEFPESRKRRYITNDANTISSRDIDTQTQARNIVSASSGSGDKRSTTNSDPSYREDRANVESVFTTRLDRAQKLRNQHLYLLGRLERDLANGELEAEELKERVHALDMVYTEATRIYISLGQETNPTPEMPEETPRTVSLRDLEIYHADDAGTVHTQSTPASETTLGEANVELPFGFNASQITEIKELTAREEWRKAEKLLPLEQRVPSKLDHQSGTRWHCRVRIYIEKAGNVSFRDCLEDYHTRDNLIRHIDEVHFGKERSKPTA
ncbi:hypothetical protein M408DRAFT_310308 [Serendipita vermifera MAFF 305830]|uniref:Uncharacterized protein n=1 Tax=Serendipita vermifera MAFF 305830 TaxID=933852 RepID=A0A0C3B8U8_SERVB|nr:hypothetical protein M408DRAFT_310308 [Serendipita vermifera MAFF 305830]